MLPDFILSGKIQSLRTWSLTSLLQNKFQEILAEFLAFVDVEDLFYSLLLFLSHVPT
jgi:hypothetical protein